MPARHRRPRQRGRSRQDRQDRQDVPEIRFVASSSLGAPAVPASGAREEQAAVPASGAREGQAPASRDGGDSVILVRPGGADELDPESEERETTTTAVESADERDDAIAAGLPPAVDLPSGGRAPRRRRRRRRLVRLSVTLFVTAAVIAAAATLAVLHSGNKPSKQTELTTIVRARQLRSWATTVGIDTTRNLLGDYQALISQGAGGSGAQECAALASSAQLAEGQSGPPAKALRKAWTSDLRLVVHGAQACGAQAGANDRNTATGPVAEVARGMGELLVVQQAAAKGHSRVPPPPPARRRRR